MPGGDKRSSTSGYGGGTRREAAPSSSARTNYNTASNRAASSTSRGANLAPGSSQQPRLPASGTNTTQSYRSDPRNPVQPQRHTVAQQQASTMRQFPSAGVRRTDRLTMPDMSKLQLTDRMRVPAGREAPRDQFVTGPTHRNGGTTVRSQNDRNQPSGSSAAPKFGYKTAEETRQDARFYAPKPDKGKGKAEEDPFAHTEFGPASAAASAAADDLRHQRELERTMTESAQAARAQNPGPDAGGPVRARASLRQWMANPGPAYSSYTHTQAPNAPVAALAYPPQQVYPPPQAQYAAQASTRVYPPPQAQTPAQASTRVYPPPQAQNPAQASTQVYPPPAYQNQPYATQAQGFQQPQYEIYGDARQPRAPTSAMMEANGRNFPNALLYDASVAPYFNETRAHWHFRIWHSPNRYGFSTIEMNKMWAHFQANPGPGGGGGGA